MDVSEMIIGVNLGVQKVDSNAYDNLLTKEIEYYLNKANREYIRRQISYLKEDLEELSRKDLVQSSKASENISTLLAEKTYSGADITDSSHYDNGEEIDISNISIFSYVYSQIKSDYFTRRACKKVSFSDISKYVKTDYNDPIFRRPVVVQVGSNYHILYGAESYDISDFYLIYVKNPSKLVESSAGSNEVTTPELPEHTHDEIVDLAVGMISEDIKSSRPYEQNQKTIREQ